MKKQAICPVEKAGQLDSRFRKLIQNPEKILNPYIKKGMTIIDFGCGPGFFSIPMAKMTGSSGRVISIDFQEGMLLKLKKKIIGSGLENIIRLEQCGKNNIGVDEKVDLFLAFYVVHEILDHDNFFSEAVSLLKPGGKIFFAEPAFHVSKKTFEISVKKAERKGFKAIKGPNLFFSRTAILENTD